jgi:hypothetical protein
MLSHADPQTKFVVKVKKILLTFNENKVTINICTPTTVIFILFIPYYLFLAAFLPSF